MTYTGWYSETAAKHHGWQVYKDSKGNEVKVTYVSKENGSDYVWTDKVCIGPIKPQCTTIVGSPVNGIDSQLVVMEGVTEYIEEEEVSLITDEAGHLVILAINECGNNHTQVDLLQLIQWLKTNRPELLQ